MGGRRGRPSWLFLGSNHVLLLPDVSESTWRGRLTPRSGGLKRQPGDCPADPEATPAPEGPPQTPAREGPEHPRTPPAKSLLSAPVRNGESPGQEGLAPERLACLILDAQRPPGDQDTGFPERSRLRKVQTFPQLPPDGDGPEASPLSLTLTSVKSQPPASEFFPPDPKKALPEGINGPSSFQPLWPNREQGLQEQGARGKGCSEERGAGVPSRGPAEERPLPSSEDPRDASRDPGTPEADDEIRAGAGEPGSAATEQVGDLIRMAGKEPAPERTDTRAALRRLGFLTSAGHFLPGKRPQPSLPSCAEGSCEYSLGACGAPGVVPGPQRLPAASLEVAPGLPERSGPLWPAAPAGTTPARSQASLLGLGFLPDCELHREQSSRGAGGGSSGAVSGRCLPSPGAQGLQRLPLVTLG